MAVKTAHGKALRWHSRLWKKASVMRAQGWGEPSERRGWWQLQGCGVATCVYSESSSERNSVLIADDPIWSVLWRLLSYSAGFASRGGRRAIWQILLNWRPTSFVYWPGPCAPPSLQHQPPSVVTQGVGLLPGNLERETGIVASPPGLKSQLCCWVTPSKLLNLPVPRFPPLENGASDNIDLTGFFLGI